MIIKLVLIAIVASMSACAPSPPHYDPESRLEPYDAAQPILVPLWGIGDAGPLPQE